MVHQIVDRDGNVLGEYDDYGEAAERLNHINDRCGPLAELRTIGEPDD